MQKEIESFPDYTISDKGEVYSKKSKKILKQHKDEKDSIEYSYAIMAMYRVSRYID